ASIVERHRNRVHEVRLTGDEFDGEPVGHSHPPDRFLRRIRLVWRAILPMRDHVFISRFEGQNAAINTQITNQRFTVVHAKRSAKKATSRKFEIRTVSY